MADRSEDKRTLHSGDDYHIISRGAYFEVSFTSPYNSTHKINGFTTEDEAHAWIAETRLLVRTYS